MKALIAKELGETDVFSFEEIAEPEISDNEVLIEVFASAMNPVDAKTRRHGLHRGDSHSKRPMTKADFEQ